MLDANAAIFDLLDTDADGAAASALREYARSMMYHKFTGMPKRGIARRVMPFFVLMPPAEWLRLGVDPADFEEPGSSLTSVWWASDAPFYEISERRLCREDFEKRLAARQVDRLEWRRHSSFERKMRRNPPTKGRSADDLERVAYRIMGELVSTILQISEARHAS